MTQAFHMSIKSMRLHEIWISQKFPLALRFTKYRALCYASAVMILGAEYFI